MPTNGVAGNGQGTYEFATPVSKPMQNQTLSIAFVFCFLMGRRNRHRSDLFAGSRVMRQRFLASRAVRSVYFPAAAALAVCGVCSIGSFCMALKYIR